MRVIAKRTLLDFASKHADSKEALLAWHQEVQKTTWYKPNDIKKEYGTADIINKKRVVFNIKGNHYRLVADIEYQIGIVFIVSVMTHSEYDKVNVEDLKHGS